MENPTMVKRFYASLVSLAVVSLSFPAIGAAETVVGTIQVSGPAWVASDSADWSRLSSTRPLVEGDRLRTGSDGYLLADMGDAGVVGLYGDAEVATVDGAQGPVIDVLKGKVAFHLSPESKLQLQAEGADIASRRTAADGYVEYNSDGTPVVVVEEGSLNIQVAGIDRTVSRGERVALGAATSRSTASTAQPVVVAGASKSEQNRKAGGAAVGGGAASAGTASAVGTTAAATGGMTVAGMTALGVVAAGVVGVAASNDDNHGSPMAPPGGLPPGPPDATPPTLSAQ